MTSPSRRVHVIPGDIMQVRIRQPQAAAAGNGLLNALIAYWPGNEASGNLIDAHTNGLDMVDRFTVTNSTGLVYATARQYTAANNEHHDIADNALLSVGDTDFTYATWVYHDTLTADQFPVGKYANAAGSREYFTDYNNSSKRYRFRIYDGTNNVGGVAADNLGQPSTATWYLIISWHDSVANTVNIQVNNGTADSAATTGAPGDTATQFYIGAIFSYGYMNGRIGPTAFWKSAAGGGGVLTAAQRTALYNSGSGLAYASFTT